MKQHIPLQTIRRYIYLVILILMTTLNTVAQTRMIVMTDIGGSDPDDTQSLIHLMLTLDDVELAGIISQHAWVPYGTGALQLINNIIDGYEQCLPNLRVHRQKFPDAKYLRSIVKEGQREAAMKGVGEGKDSEGSEWIIKEVDKKDSRPLWISAWSGMNTLAQALWKVKHTRTTKDFDKFIAKLRVYDVLGQDDAGAWIAKNFPNLIYIRNKEIYGWGPSDQWTKEHIQEMGPLGRLYPNRKWATEGDSPSFLYCLDNGLNAPEHPEWGGWGGRFSTTRKAGIRGMDWVARNGLDEPQYDPYFMLPAAKEGSASISRWKEAIYNDFAARAKWSVTPEYSQANHHPQAFIGKDGTKNVLEKDVKAETTITLDASRSTDPDGDSLRYHWYVYKEASTFGEITIDDSASKVCRITIPQASVGKTIHIVLEVTDNGMPSLTSYRRVVINVLK